MGLEPLRTALIQVGIQAVLRSQEHMTHCKVGKVKVVGLTRPALTDHEPNVGLYGATVPGGNART